MEKTEKWERCEREGDGETNSSQAVVNRHSGAALINNRMLAKEIIEATMRGKQE